MLKDKLPEYSNQFLLLQEIVIVKTVGSAKERVNTKSIQFNNNLIGKNSLLKEIDSVLRIPFLNASNEMKKLLPNSSENQESVEAKTQENRDFASYSMFGSLIYPFMEWSKYCNLIKFLIDKKAILFDDVSCETQDIVGDDDDSLSLDDMHCIVGYLVENFILRRMNI